MFVFSSHRLDEALEGSRRRFKDLIQYVGEVGL
jgi:hypothetical protein